MSKAVIMKTSGIVSVNGKNAKAGKILVDGDVVKTGPESFTAWIDVKDKTTFKMNKNQTFTFTDMTNKEMRVATDATRGGGQLISTTKKSRDGVDSTFTIENPTGTASTKG
jgi:ribosomal 50S subunit-recycling heat shock protein